jgi:hypothetical protein
MKNIIVYDRERKVPRYLSDKDYRRADAATRSSVGVRLGLGSVVRSMESDKPGTPITFICSTGSVDRYDSTIAVDGWDLSNFARNAIMPWCHKTEQPPIARWQNWRTEDDALKMDAVFVPLASDHDWAKFALMIEEMYRKHLMNAVSVGFIPVKYEIATDRDDGESWMPPIDYLEQELTECSAVPVPGQAEALAEGRSVADPFLKARAAGVDMSPMIRHLERTMEELNGSGLWVRRDVAEQLRTELGGSKTYSIPAQPGKEQTVERKKVRLVVECNVADVERMCAELSKKARNGGGVVLRAEPVEEDDGGDATEAFKSIAKDFGKHVAALGDVTKSLGKASDAFGGHDMAFVKHAEAFGTVAKSLAASVDALKPNVDPKSTANKTAPTGEARGGASHKLSSANSADHKLAMTSARGALDALTRIESRQNGNDAADGETGTDKSGADKTTGTDASETKTAPTPVTLSAEEQKKAALEAKVKDLQLKLDAAEQRATGKIPPKRS